MKEKNEEVEVAKQLHEVTDGLRNTVTLIIGKYMSIQSELKNCRNELCLKCGNYRNAHNGACDDCRYRHGGEWEENFNG